MSTLKKWTIFVGLPTFFVLIYFGIWASDMYVSEAKFSLRSPEQHAPTDLFSFLGQSATGTGADAYIIQEYLSSPELLREVNQELNIKQHYQNKNADFWSRLGAEPTQEEFITYFQKQVSLSYDQISGILTLQVRAFSPEIAQQLCQKILEKSETLVNSLRDSAIEDSLALARSEIERAERRLSQSQIKIRQFREMYNLLDPQAEAGALQGLVAELENAAAKVRTELTEVRSYMQEDSNKVISLKTRIKALEKQIGAEKVRLTGKDQSTVSSLASEYEQLALEHEFAQKQYLSATASIEAARLNAESQSRYLVAFIEPILPDEATWPHRGYAIGVSIGIILISFGLGTLIFAAVREHAGV